MKTDGAAGWRGKRQKKVPKEKSTGRRPERQPKKERGRTARIIKHRAPPFRKTPLYI